MSQMTREDDGRAGSGRRRAVLGVLKDTAAALSISEIAEQVGVHPNTVRFHLDTLIENGQVERVETDRHAPGRPPLFFRAVRGMDPTGPRGYRLLAEVLVHSMAIRDTSACQGGRCRPSLGPCARHVARWRGR